MTSAEFDTLVVKMQATFSTNGEWICKCPAHDDESPSLSLKLKDEKFLFHCFAGCSQARVLESLKDYLPRVSSPKSDTKERTEHMYYNWDGTMFGKVSRVYSFFNGEKVKNIYSREYDNVLKQWATKKDGKPKGMSAKTAPLYNLLALKSASEGRVVFIVEGEGKADLLNANGLLAVCNQGGAGKWSDHLCPPLLGKKIILCPDNDEAGMMHISVVARSLRAHNINDIHYLELPDLNEGEDCVQYIERNGINAFKELAKKAPKYPELEGESVPKREFEKTLEHETNSGPKVRSGKATTLDYQKFFQKHLPIRRDIFSADGMYWDEKMQLWSAVLNKVPTFKCEMRDVLAQGCPIKFHPSHIEDNLNHYVDTLPLELLIDVEEWDGRDRIQEMCNAVEFDETTKMNSEMFGYFLKDWFKTAFMRTFNPEVQNRMIILQGMQGAGKDFFVEVLTRTLGQFCSSFQVSETHNKDMYLQLNNNMILKIGEFDKTGRLHVSILKDIITSVNTQIRASHERKAKTRPSRASFISTANVPDILRDSTGNRRYLVFFIKHIEWNYPKTAQDSNQVLAQAFHYYKTNHKFDEVLVRKAEDTMKSLIDLLTPENPEEIVIELYLSEVKRIQDDQSIEYMIMDTTNRMLSDNQVAGIMKVIRERTQYSEKAIRGILTRRGFRKMTRINGKPTRAFLMDPVDSINHDTSEATEKENNVILRRLTMQDQMEKGGH